MNFEKENMVLTARIKSPVFFEEDLTQLEDKTFWKITYRLSFFFGSFYIIKFALIVSLSHLLSFLFLSIPSVRPDHALLSLFCSCILEKFNNGVIIIII